MIEELAAEIRRYAGAAMLAFADTVGRIVFEQSCGSDVEGWRSHGAKDVSLRRLVARSSAWATRTSRPKPDPKIIPIRV